MQITPAHCTGIQRKMADPGWKINLKPMSPEVQQRWGPGWWHHHLVQSIFCHYTCCTPHIADAFLQHADVWTSANTLMTCSLSPPPPPVPSQLSRQSSHCKMCDWKCSHFKNIHSYTCMAHMGQICSTCVLFISQLPMWNTSCQEQQSSCVRQPYHCFS